VSPRAGAAPVRLGPNLVDHFYRGGRRIADLRGIRTTSERQPEEWVAATVARDGHSTLGLARTVDGQLLRDLVVADPEHWTGGTGAWPGDVGLLLKLLDAGQRLPVHVHPDRDFAARHLDCPYGKTEAWLVLDADPGAAVHLGWDRDVDPADVARARDAQDGAWMLERMHRVEVRRGDAFLVPAGTPHAIGAGVFVAEAQEPTDFSILLEWSVTTSTREESHLGLGFDLATQALGHAATSLERLAEVTVSTDLDATSVPLTSLLPAEADPFFRLDLATGGATVAAGFAAVVVLDGSGSLVGGSSSTHVRRGATLAVPAGLGDWRVAGDVRLLVARPGVSRG
jgi:mannose-6-phosphate isomerase